MTISLSPAAGVEPAEVSRTIRLQLPAVESRNSVSSPATDVLKPTLYTSVPLGVTVEPNLKKYQPLPLLLTSETLIVVVPSVVPGLVLFASVIETVPEGDAVRADTFTATP